jgi:DivIVA domain-containing protein
MSTDESRGAFAPVPGVPGSITPLDIQQKEFRVSKFGGYRMRDVDEFLDELTDAMTALYAENERLRAGAAVEPSQRADAIVAEAQGKADRILEEASQRASLPRTHDEADVAAVDAFLTKERDFIQQLADVVQRHARAVKEMARASRQAAQEPQAEQPAQEVTSVPEAAEGPIRVDEPEPAAVPRRSDEAHADSLRELFWGEED